MVSATLSSILLLFFQPREVIWKMAEHSECDPVSFIDVGCWLLFVRLLCIKFLCIRLLCIKFLCIRLLFVILLFFSCLKKFEAWQSEAEHSRLEILSYAASCLAGSWKYLLTPFPSDGGISVGFSYLCSLYFLFLFSIAMVRAILFLDALFLYGLSNKAACNLLFFSLCGPALLSWCRRKSSNLRSINPPTPSKT